MNPSFYTVAIPRLYDEYMEARANALHPNNALAIKKLNAIIDSAIKARNLIEAEGADGA